ncbi:MAG TPA: hypothetical protein VHG89_06315 [Verrucomicrobiae bacterium]|nr:hypothetical protein [Verrucomicrobiae bacterium]
MIAWIYLGSKGATWYDWMFLGLAIVIIFPDEALDNVGLILNWHNLIWLEVIFIGIVITAVIILKRFYPELHWFLPLIAIGLVAFIRGIIWFISRSAGDD